MRVKFDVTGNVKKMTGFDKLEGDASLDAHFEVEFGPEELGMIYEAQRTLVPEVLNFVKEMQQIQNEKEKSTGADNRFEILDLKDKIRNLEIALEGEKARHEATKKNRDEYFNKYIKCLDQENMRIKKETEEFRKSFKQEEKVNPKEVLKKALEKTKEEEDEDDLY